MATALSPQTKASTDAARQALHRKYRDLITVNPALSRGLVSYQSNRNRAYYRWFKYKEGFSASLVEYVLDKFSPRPGDILDPFAGSGAALFASRDRGWQATGIELLPVGAFAMRARLAAERVSAAQFRGAIDRFRKTDWRAESDADFNFQHLSITKGAFPTASEIDLVRFRTYAQQRIRNEDIRLLFEAASLAVLESISYTRKDGQYLRWDERAPRSLPGKRFNKGQILPFEDALVRQLTNMLDDMAGAGLFGATSECEAGGIKVLEGSCLDLLPKAKSDSFDLVITSPPYCNRYDYTRTYALELAYLGVDSERLKEFRQALLSCTVENRAKEEALFQQYKRLSLSDRFDRASASFYDNDALQEVLGILEAKGRAKELNNANVPRMVRNYFFESALVVHEIARLVRGGGRVVMVNDNVQYAGEEVPVDLILCEFAADAGLETEHIWTLGRGKGNSSQQMGAHGRNELRKCAYVWRKPT